MALVDAYDSRTGTVRQVPEHWIGHPVHGATLTRGTTPPDPEPGEPALEDRTIPALREHAEQIGADLTGLTKKADIVAAITAHQAAKAAPDQPPAPVGDDPNQEV